jgi:hypothetical protein
VRKALFRIGVGLVTLGLGHAIAEDVAIIVNKSNPVENLTLVDARKLILAEQAQWSNGKPVMVLLRAAGTPERQTTLQVICGMNETEFTQHFLHASFNGGTATPPKSLGAAAVLRQLVTAVAGAIGFVNAADVNDSVKVVKLEGHAPGEDVYKLRK